MTPRKKLSRRRFITLHPKNPHYFLFRGKPTVLITSAEHYGSVINADFNYTKYLDTLAEYGLNYTRIYPGAYFETDGYFVKDNPLGPRTGRHILPWRRSSVPGYPLGGNLFDLDSWDERYFERFRDFITQAGDRGIVVEVCLFNCMYPDLWHLMPLHHKNNIQGIGTCDATHVQTLNDAALVRYQEAYVKKITREVREFDNVIIEICDEPGIYGLTEEEYRPWLDRMINAVRAAERGLPEKHLIAQQVCGMPDGAGDLSNDPRVQVVTGQYVWMATGGQVGGMKLLDCAYHRNKPIELNETSYYPIWYEEGDRAGAARAEAWEFIVGGGAGFNQLNSYYSTDNPTGAGTENDRILTALKNLRKFMESFDFLRMRPYYIASNPPAGAFVRCMCEPGRQYALYLHHSTLIRCERYHADPGTYRDTFMLIMPPGVYTADWVDPATGATVRTDRFSHPGGNCTFSTPEFSFDIALRVKRG